MAQVACHRCGRELPEIVTVCPDCGSLTETADHSALGLTASLDPFGPTTVGRLCPQCGREVSELMTVCPACGALVSDLGESPPGSGSPTRRELKAPIEPYRLVGGILAIVGVLLHLALFTLGTGAPYSLGRILAWLMLIGGAITYLSGPTGSQRDAVEQ
jgi:RNA polymerase subunit RPABC4/transcription elongation factor Spt4